MRHLITILSSCFRLSHVSKHLFSFVIALVATIGSNAQSQSQLVKYLQGFAFTESVPKDLLASKSVVLYTYNITSKEMETIQHYFQQTGIDAVAYFDADIITAGKDVESAYLSYFSKRAVKHLIFIEHNSNYIVNFVSLGDSKLIDNAKSVWAVADNDLVELLQNVYRTALYDQPKKNYLINDIPEPNISVNIFNGKRAEYFAIDLKIDQLAVQKSGNEAYDLELEQLFTNTYPFKFVMVDSDLPEKEIRKNGITYLLCSIHTRGEVAKNLLSYTMSPSETAISSVTFPNGDLHLKTIPKESTIYKFYIRHIDSGNTFLGTKWDADVLWQDALRNHIKSFKSELKIN